MRWKYYGPLFDADDGAGSGGGDGSPAPPAAAAAPAAAPVDLGKVRELILAANPGVVPEMIAGDSFDGLLASVEPAKAAYTRIADAMKAGSPAAAVAGVGSGGAPGRSFVVNIEELSPAAKISEGLRQRNRAK